MKFLLKNASARKHMGLIPGQGYLPGLPAKEVSHEEMIEIAGALSKAMAPVEHYLYPGPVDKDDLTKGTASLGAWRAQDKRIHCICVDDDGKETELSAKDVAELYAEEIAAQHAARVNAKKERDGARRKMFTR